MRSCCCSAPAAGHAEGQGGGEVHGPLCGRARPVPLHLLRALAAPDHGRPVLPVAGHRIGAVAGHGPVERGGADLHPGGLLVRENGEKRGEGRREEKRRRRR